MSKHTFVHIELSARDPKKAADFYAKVFEWSIQEIPEMNYIMFDEGGGIGGGFNPFEADGIEPGDVILYISTEDIEASLAEIEAAGGKTLREKTEIPGMGWYAFFADPSGNKLGLYTGMSA